MSDRALRPYQETTVDLVRASLRTGHRRPVLQLPTGAGETLIASEIIGRALQRGNCAIFTVPRISLIEQTLHAFEREGIWNVGVIQGAHNRTNPSAPVQIASAQTLARRNIPAAALVIIDECHMQFKSITKWIASPDWSDVPFIGLTATPWASGMGKSYDDLIIPVSISQLIADGYLSPFRVFAPPGPDLTGPAFARRPVNSMRVIYRPPATKRKSSPMSSALGSKRARTGRRFAMASTENMPSICKSGLSRPASQQNTSIATPPCSTARISLTGSALVKPRLSVM